MKKITGIDRRKFLKNCGFACLSSVGLTTVLQSCGATKLISGNIIGDNIAVALSDFEIKHGNETYYKKYLVIQNDVLLYPICVYRFNEKTFTALWMRCTHQGSELQVFGDKLQCPAHGSEFDNKGVVKNGPADHSLRTFAITLNENKLLISLKAV